MITKKDLSSLYEWARDTEFPLRNERITSKYMGYGLKICYIKGGVNLIQYPNKELSEPVIHIIENKEILGVYFLSYPPNMVAPPHRDYNPHRQPYKRIQIPTKVEDGFIEWTATGEKVYWQEGKPEVFNVEEEHQGANNSNTNMEFLYVDVKLDTIVESL